MMRRQLNFRIPRDLWLSWEEAHYAKFNMGHVLGYIDVKPLRVASRDPKYMCPVLGYPCLKALMVVNVSMEVLFVSIKPGSYSDQQILETSSFGKALRNRNNPLNLPCKMRFRSGTHIANPVFLTDRKFSSMYSPYLYVSNGSLQVNNVRLVIEDFFGRFVATNRYYMSRTWLEHNHNTRAMIKASVNIYNFRLLMDTDELCVHNPQCGHDMVHSCTLWCPHYSSRVVDGAQDRVTRIRSDFSARTILTAEWGRRVIRNVIAEHRGHDQEQNIADANGLQLN